MPNFPSPFDAPVLGSAVSGASIARVEVPHEVRGENIRHRFSDWKKDQAQVRAN
jgi:hypothetical protein